MFFSSRTEDISDEGAGVRAKVITILLIAKNEYNHNIESKANVHTYLLFQMIIVNSIVHPVQLVSFIIPFCQEFIFFINFVTFVMSFVFIA